MSTKTILYLITVSEQGGAQKYVADLATHAVTQFNKVYLIYGSQGQGEAFKNLPVTVEQHMWSELVRSIRPYKDLLFLFRLIKFLKRNHIDVIHCNSSKAGFFGRLAARICKVSCIVYTVHGYVFREPMHWGIKALYWTLEYWAAAWTDIQISVNREDAEYTQKKFQAQKVIWIPNGIAVRTVDPDKQATLKTQWGLRPDQKKLGTVANFYATKNHSGFLGPFRKLVDQDPEYHWFVVGEGPLHSRFEQKCHELNLHKNVHVLGHQKDIPEFLSSIDLFVLPSVKEGMPYTILEAMAYRVPILAAPVGGVLDVIQDGINGWHLKSNSLEAAQQSIRIFENKSVREKMLLQAHSDFEAKYTLKAMLEKTFLEYF